MNGKIKKFFLVSLLIFIFAFILNFVWESYHSIFLYNCCQYIDTLSYLKLISYVSIIDSLIILLMYSVVGLFYGSLWMEEIERTSFYLFLVLGLIVAAFIEYKAIFVLNKWSYTELMPTIFGIGFSPLIQLSFTGLLTILIVRKLAD